MMYPKINLNVAPYGVLELKPATFKNQIENPPAEVRTSAEFGAYLDGFTWEIREKVGGPLMFSGSVSDGVRFLLFLTGVKPDDLDATGFCYRETGWFGGPVDMSGAWSDVYGAICEEFSGCFHV